MKIDLPASRRLLSERAEPHVGPALPADLADFTQQVRASGEAG